MKWTIRIALLLIIGFPVGNMQAQNPGGLELLTKVENKILTADKLSMTMELDIFIPGNESQLIKGTFVKNGKQYRLSSDNVDMISNGTYAWSIQKSEGVAYIGNATDGESPLDIISDYNKEDYEYNFIPDYNEGNRLYRAVVLKPKARNADYTKVRILIDDKDNLYSFFVVSRSGERTVLTVKDVKYNTSVDASTFTFNEADYPGIQLEDLRLD